MRYPLAKNEKVEKLLLVKVCSFQDCLSYRNQIRMKTENRHINFPKSWKV